MEKVDPEFMLAAQKTKGIETSIWVDIANLAAEVNPLNLGQGFASYAAYPSYMPQALAESCGQNDKETGLVSDHLLNQYTRGFGHPRLVNVLAKLYSRLLGREIDAENNVFISIGADQALYSSICGLVNKGDEVIIIEPFYSYMPLVQLAGGTPVYVPLRPTKGELSSADWKLDPVELENAFSEKTKLIIVNTPNNPLGKMYSEEELKMIGGLCKKYDAYAIMDEVYEWMPHDGNKHVRMASFPEMWGRCISIGSAGKTFSITGWKIGWAVGHENLLAGPKVIHQHSIYACATPLQEALAKAFEKELERLDTPECYFTKIRLELDSKRERLVRVLKEAGFNPIIPQGGYFIFVDFSEIMGKVGLENGSTEPKDFRFVKWMSRNRGLQGIPCSGFFSEKNRSLGEKYVRFCFIKTDCELDQAGVILKKLREDIDKKN